MTPALSTRRLAAVTVTLFVLTLAFLAGRVHAGADPTQAAAPASSVTRSEPAPAGGVPPSSAPDQGGGGAVPDADPPSTFAS